MPDKCQWCNVPPVEKSQKTEGKYIVTMLECGHTHLSTVIREAFLQDKIEPKPEPEKVQMTPVSQIPEDSGLTKYQKITSTDGKTLYPYQIRAVNKLESAGGSGLIAVKVGRGKTIISIAYLEMNADESLPVVIVAKTSILTQWQKEVNRWGGRIAQILNTGKDMPLPGFKYYITTYDLIGEFDWSIIQPKTIILDECQAIKNTAAKRTQKVRNIAGGIIKIQRVYSDNLNDRTEIETLARSLMAKYEVSPRFSLNFEDIGDDKLGLCECHVEGEGVIKGRITINSKHAIHDKIESIKETILHEIAHAITPGAGHGKMWRETSLSIGGNGQATANCDGSIEFKAVKEQRVKVIGSSGTPIKNHAGEFFPILNLIDPKNFYSKEAFIRDYCQQYQSGNTWKIGGISKCAEAHFRKLVDRFMIQFDDSEMESELPALFRQYSYSDMSSEVKKAYEKAAGDFQEKMDEIGEGSGTFQQWNDILSYINIMRQLVGHSKVIPTANFIRDFLENEIENETKGKIAIFVHHKMVGQRLMNELQKVCSDLKLPEPLQMTAEMNMQDRSNVIERFEKSDAQICVLSTLAAGEGLNLQFCSTFVIMERQWNPANEEQAEGRFIRIGAVKSSVTGTYMVALGTIDEYFAELVERKREIVKKTMTGKETVAWDQSQIIQEISRLLSSKNKSRWTLQNGGK